MKKVVLVVCCVLGALLVLSGSSVAAGQSKVDKRVPVAAKYVELTKKVQIKGDKGSRKPPKTASQAATGILGSEVSGDRYAIVVGISDYPGTVNDLEYCDDDAMDVAKALNGYGFTSNNSINLLTDDDATRFNIISAIDSLAAQVSPDDEVVFYFSGHGGRGVANDFDREKVDECIWAHNGSSLVPIWDGELAALFADFNTSRIVFIFDSCYAGGMTDLKGSGRIVAMASTENSLSYELSNLANGEFTYYMIDQGMISYEADKYDDASIDGPDVTIEESWDYTKLNCRYDSITINDAFANDLLP